MNQSNYRITLNINGISSPVTLSLKRGETARRIHITLTEDSKPYQISPNCYAYMLLVKEDGTGLQHSCTIQDNAVLYDLQPSTTSTNGNVKCEVVLCAADGHKIISATFVIAVYSTVFSEEEIENSNEFKSLSDLIYTVNNKLDNGEFQASIAVGTVTTGEPNTEVSVTNKGSSKAAILDFVIPKGDKGEKGDKGDLQLGETADTAFAGDRGVALEQKAILPYNSSKTYSKNDIVVYKDRFYKALTSVPIGYTPSFIYYWKDITGVSEHTKNKPYKPDDLVTYNGTIYRSKTTNQGNIDPETDTGWEKAFLDLIEPIDRQTDFVMIEKDYNGYRQVQKTGTYTPKTSYSSYQPVLRGLSGQLKGQTPPLANQTDLDLINRGELKEYVGVPITSNYHNCMDWMTYFGWNSANPCPMGLITDVIYGQLIINQPTIAPTLDEQLHGYGGLGLVTIMFKLQSDRESFYASATTEFEYLDNTIIPLHFKGFPTVGVELTCGLRIETCGFIDGNSGEYGIAKVKKENGVTVAYNLVASTDAGKGYYDEDVETNTVYEQYSICVCKATVHACGGV